MGYQFNVLTGKFDRAGEGTEGPAGTVSAAGDGTATAPSISFSSDTNTGLYNTFVGAQSGRGNTSASNNV